MNCTSRQRQRLRFWCFEKRVAPGKKRLAVLNERFDQDTRLLKERYPEARMEEVHSLKGSRLAGLVIIEGDRP